MSSKKENTTNLSTNRKAGVAEVANKYIYSISCALCLCVNLVDSLDRRIGANIDFNVIPID